MPANTSENTTRVVFTIDKELKKEAEEYARKDRRSLSNFINIAIEEYIKGKKGDT